MTQKEMVMEYLTNVGTMTPLDAFREYGITKLATVVSELIRVDGENIVKERKTSKNRFGRSVTYMTYRLGE